MSIKTFKRVEKKFMLDNVQFQSLIEILGGYMTLDEHSKNGEVYPIYNIYYDTDQNDLIRRSISKPYYKEKLRLRSYNLIDDGEAKVFLELKKKIGGVVSKRRAKLSFDDAQNFVENGVIPKAKGYVGNQVVAEIAEFLAKTKVSPKVYIGYKRLAFFGKDDESFRVTFDSEIKTRRNQLDFFEDRGGKPLLPSDKFLMEVKINGSIPIWLAHALSSLNIYSTSFSKYGTEYKQHCAKKPQLAYIAPQTLQIQTRREKHYA